MGLALGLYGAFSKMSIAVRISTIWLFTSFSLFAITYAYSDSDVYMLPANLALSVWIGLSLEDLSAAQMKKRYRWSQLLSFIFLAGLLVRSLYLFPELDASRDSRAEDFGSRVIASVPQNALVFTNTDKETFSLWYFHYALRQRPDLAIIASGLLPFDWYQESLGSTYPDLTLPGSFPRPETVAADNPSRPACFVAYNNQTEIECP